MFTGLVEAIGTVLNVRKKSCGKIFILEAPFVGELVAGESVAVEGVCLTVVGRKRAWFEVEVVPETLKGTSLNNLKKGARVNLERALKIGDRLGGHFVQGHVDGVGEIVGFDRGKGEVRLSIRCPASLRKFIAEKGSIALSGVSLTVAKVKRNCFEVALIPHTLENTSLGEIKVGDKVNLEVDLVARYLKNLL